MNAERMRNSDYQRLMDLACARDDVANKAAAALTTLVQKGLVSVPSVVKLAQEWDVASKAHNTEFARGQAARVIEKARESSLRAGKGSAG